MLYQIQIIIKDIKDTFIIQINLSTTNNHISYEVFLSDI